ncbi:hypothetical protein CWC22_022400 [Pseudoalteromonas rubra]|uniref:Uncharacterized protein n=1 Tax=Pseudoalteromonas rubra TaxID=43658 RepID=A0A5S3UVZ7_9GAMM|nr:hypothetical protein [Pseudoalteromonas rubra]QPB85759.1 hypothetical protein CWC22_022400 [Pseudoalteromonas rubra]
MKYLLGSALILTSTLANAAADQWTAKVKVVEIYTGYKGGHFLFKTSGTHINPANCGETGLYSVEAANADVKSIYSALLAAKVSNQDVKIAIAGSRCGTSSLDHVRNKPSVSRIGLF